MDDRDSMDRPVAVDDLTAAARRLAASGDAQETLTALLDGSRLAAPRGALLVVRQGEVRLWNSFGYPAETVARLRQVSCRIGEGRLGRLADAETPALDEGGHGLLTDEAGDTETVGRRVAVAGRPIAVLTVARGPGELPWSPAAIDLLAIVAGLRLELSLVERRLGSATAGARGERSAGGVAENAALSPLAPTDEPSPEVVAARRFARLVATDIRLYNEEAVVLGRRHGDLCERLREPLRRGIETFQDRHASLGDEGLRVLHEALVDVLAAGDTTLLPPGGLTR